MSQLIVYTSASDGHLIRQSTGGFSVVRNSATGNVVDESSGVAVGLSRDSLTWYLRKAFLFFDTSALPDGAIISSAVLSIEVYDIVTSGGHFDIVIQNGQPTYPHDPLEIGDFLYSQYSGDGGSVNSSTFVHNTWSDITLNSDGKSWINKTGTTKLCLRTSNDIDNDDVGVSTGSRTMFYALEWGSAYRAKLVIDYYTITATAAIATSITGSLTVAKLLTSTTAIITSIIGTLTVPKVLASTATIATSITGSLTRGVTEILTATSNIVVSMRTTLSDGLTEALSAIANIAISSSGSLSRGKTETLTSTTAITTSIISALVKVSDILTSTANIAISITARLLKDYISITKADRTYISVSDVTSPGTAEDKFTWANTYPNYDTWVELGARAHWCDWYFATKFVDAWTSKTTPSRTYTDVTKSAHGYVSVTTPDKEYKEVTKHQVDV